MSPISYIVFMFILIANTTEMNVPQKTLLTIYYESKCPDSRAFIADQLVPTLQHLHEYIVLRLIPFGKAHSINRRHFQCQHGPSECKGNMVQSCALEAMEGNRSDTEKTVYVYCEMETQAGTRGNLQCVERAGVDVNWVAQCVSSDYGIMLQLRNEELTNVVRPKFIPTITLDDTFNQQIQDSALKDLEGTLCSYLKEVPKCARRYNHIAMNYVLL